MSAHDEDAGERRATSARRLEWSVQIGVAGLFALALQLAVTWLLSAVVGIVVAVLAWPLLVVAIHLGRH